MNNDFYQQLLLNIDEGIYFVDVNRCITFWNKGAERITGFTSEDVIGKYCYDNILNHIDDSGKKLCLSGCPLHTTINDGQPRSISIYLHHKDGHRVPVTVRSVQISEEGKALGAVELFTDNSEYIQITQSLEKLTSIALFDQLTQLPNRRYLDTFLNSRFKEYSELGISFGLIFIDIDFFKKINDTYGHQTGDDVLIMVSKSIQGALRSSDLLARNGGEEFVAVLPIKDDELLRKVCEKLRILVQNSVLRHNEIEISVTISLGATLVNESDTSLEIINRADQLMYQSKTNGRNRVTLG